MTIRDRSSLSERSLADGQIVKIVRDFMIGLFVFSALAGMIILDGGGMSSSPVMAGWSAPVSADATGTIESRPMAHASQHANQPYVALVVLAAVFSALTAFNLAFLRRLRARYSWRRRTGFYGL
ncbi:MAG: hypothetical protein AAFO75_01845 [Pseudomonadota bacterium]